MLRLGWEGPPEGVQVEDWLRSDGPDPGSEVELVQLSAPAGSVAIYDSRTLHAMSTVSAGTSSSISVSVSSLSSLVPASARA